MISVFFLPVCETDSLTNDDLPHLRGDIRMVLTWLMKLLFSLEISSMRLMNAFPVTTFPKINGDFMAQRYKTNLHDTKWYDTKW